MKYARTSSGLWVPSCSRQYLHGLRLSDPPLLARSAGGTSPFDPSSISGLTLWLDGDHAFRQLVASGTASVTNGSSEVDGGTAFTSEARAGDSVYGVDGSGNITSTLLGTVDHVNDDTQLILTSSAPMDWSTGIAFRSLAGDGDSISLWGDISGNGHDATQATSSKCPVLSAAAINSKPALVGDGVDDQLLVADAPALNPTTAISYFVVLSTTSTGFTDHMGVIEKESWNSTYGLLLINGATPRFAIGGNYQDAPQLTANTFYVVSCVFDGSTVKTWINGTLSASASYSGAIPTGSQPLRIFSEWDRWYLNGSIAELIFYGNQALSSTDRHNVEAWLGAKYGITIAP